MLSYPQGIVPRVGLCDNKEKQIMTTQRHTNYFKEKLVIPSKQSTEDNLCKSNTKRVSHQLLPLVSFASDNSLTRWYMYLVQESLIRVVC